LKLKYDEPLANYAFNGFKLRPCIKEAMRAAETVSTEDCKVRVSLVASPLYVITTHTLDKDFGIKLVAGPWPPVFRSLVFFQSSTLT